MGRFAEGLTTALTLTVETHPLRPAKQEGHRKKALDVDSSQF